MKPQKNNKFEVDRNSTLLNEWKIKPSESWDDIFMNKTSISSILSMGCRACLKFHVKWMCYIDCRHKAAHTVLQGDDKVKLDNYIKVLRGEWFFRQGPGSDLPEDKISLKEKVKKVDTKEVSKVSNVKFKYVTKEQVEEEVFEDFGGYKDRLILPSNLGLKLSSRNLQR